MKNFFRKSKNSARFAVLAFSVFICFLNFQAALAATSVSGEILTDTVWAKAGSPYVVEDYIEVGESVTLTIEPGVVVKFNQSYLDVYGKIIASGTEEEKIFFTSFLDDSVGGDTNGDGIATEPSPGDWFGINFYSPSTGSKFEYADFKYSITNLYLNSSDLEILNSSISFAGDTAIISNESDLSVANSVFDGNYYGIDTTKGSLVLRGNFFTRPATP